MEGRETPSELASEKCMTAHIVDTELGLAVHCAACAEYELVMTAGRMDEVLAQHAWCVHD